MDRYGYTTNGYTTYNGIEPCGGGGNDGWNKPSSGHVCRPVIVDAEGRKQPIIRYKPTTHKTETYMTETYVEHVAGMPPVIDHGNRTNPLSIVLRRLAASNSPTKVYNNSTPTVNSGYDDYNDYNNKTNGGGRDGYYRRDDPVYEQPVVANHGGRDGYYRRRDDDPVVHEQPKLTNHGGRDGYYRRDDPVVHKQPMVTNHGGRDGYYRRDDPVVHEHGGRDGYYRRDDPVVHEQPMVTNHGGRDGYYRRDDPVVHEHGGRDGYYRRDDPVVHEQPMVTNHGGGRDGYYRRKDDDPVVHEQEQPMVTNHGGWTRPNQVGWSAPPPSNDSSLSKPMTEIATAMEYLKEAEGKKERITAPATFGRPAFKFAVPTKSQESYPPVTTVKAAETVIDSSEAKRRYGKLNNNHNKERENSSSPAIDSREAMRRYNGTLV